MSLLKDLEELCKPTPALPDIEDDDIDGTSAKRVFDSSEAGTNGGAADFSLKRSKLFLSDIDDIPGGKVISRNELFGDSSDMVGIRAGSSAENSDESGDEDENMDSGNEGENGDDGSDAASEEGGVSSDDDEPAAPRKSVSKSNILSTIDSRKQEKKKKSVKAQLAAWDQFLHAKIKLQAALRTYNQLPRGDMYQRLVKEADEETKQNLKTVKANALLMVQQLLNIEKRIVGPILAKNDSDKGGDDSDDEEIESDMDGEGEDITMQDGGSDNEDNIDESDGSIGDQSDDDSNETPNNNKKASLFQLNKIIKENDKKFVKYRNTTLTKWDERTKLVNPSRNSKKDFSAFDHGILQHLEKVMNDKSRLLKRVRTKRSDAERLGGDENADEDLEIFDDDDFYQTLLKDLIDRRQKDTTDPLTLSRHFVEMQKLKSKRSKKKITDNRTSKDRKIKYIALPKLVNFHPSRPETIPWTHEQRNELFKSLFT